MTFWRTSIRCAADSPPEVMKHYTKMKQPPSSSENVDDQRECMRMAFQLIACVLACLFGGSVVDMVTYYYFIFWICMSLQYFQTVCIWCMHTHKIYNIYMHTCLCMFIGVFELFVEQCNMINIRSNDILHCLNS